MTAAQAAFVAPVAASFAASGSAMAAGAGTRRARGGVSPRSPLPHPNTTKSYAAAIARLLPRGGGVSASVAAIPVGRTRHHLRVGPETQATSRPT